MTVECPHCTTRVLAAAGAACPSCGGDLSAKKPRSPHVRLTISDAEPLPPVCSRCGEPTDGVMLLEASRTVGAVPWPLRIFYYLGIALGGLLAPRLVGKLAVRGHLVSGTGTTTATTKTVPVCKPCKKKDPPRLDHADPDRGELTFQASRKFARALTKLRAERAPAPLR